MAEPDPRLAALAVIRDRWCSDAHFSNGNAVSAMGAGAEGFRASMRADGSWADVDYGCQLLIYWSAGNHLKRLLAMACAWRGGAAGDASRPDEMLQAVLCGLRFWYDRSPQNPNWWWMQIGAPALLAEVLMRVHGSCDRSYIARAVPAFESHQPVLRFTGANLVWTAGVEVAHGLLVDDPALVSQGMQLIGREVRVCPAEEGLQPDMSFFQHGRLLYSGGYGQNFAADVARFIWLADGTAYAWPRHGVDLFARFLLDGSRWMVRGRTFEYGAIGREISRAGHENSRFLRAANLMARVEHPRREEFAAIAAAGEDARKSFVSGNRHFWSGNLMVHHRDDYCISVRVASDRLENVDFPCGGGEGRLCHHLAEGGSFVMRDGDEYRDVFSVWNWRRVPGATVEQHPRPMNVDELVRRGERAFAGGASDGEVGCAAMDFSRMTLSAKKAWFFFDRCMVALGAGIASAADVPVCTTINQCRRRGSVFIKGRSAPLADGVHALAAGSAFSHDGVGYAILRGQGEMRLQTQHGAWSDCGVGSGEPQSQAVFTAAIDHGPGPRDAEYAYVVAPGLAADAVDVSPLTITRNDVQVQAVWHAKEHRGHAVFYEAGAVEFPDAQSLAVNAPCIVLYRPVEGRIDLTLADPAGQAAAVTVKLSRPDSLSLTVPLPQHEHAGAAARLTVAR